MVQNLNFIVVVFSCLDHLSVFIGFDYFLANFGSSQRFWRRKMQDVPSLYFSHRIVKFPFNANTFCEKRTTEKVDEKKSII